MTRTDEPVALFWFRRDLQIRLMLDKSGIPFHTFRYQVIFEKNEVVKSDGTPYTVFTPYLKVWKKKLTQGGLTLSPSEKLEGNFLKTAPLLSPSLEEMASSGLIFSSLRRGYPPSAQVLLQHW
jgi:deoxyribodipyrimidine photolyase